MKKKIYVRVLAKPYNMLLILFHFQFPKYFSTFAGFFLSSFMEFSKSCAEIEKNASKVRRDKNRIFSRVCVHI